MKTLREFLENDPLITADAKLRQQDGYEFFGEYLSPSVDPVWLRILSNFTHNIPLRYWDKPVVQKALEILDMDKQRTIQALVEWKYRIGMGFENLLRRASVEKYEDGLSTAKSSDLILLANDFHPEYLRRCEHIYTNIISLYWAVLKKKSVQGKFDISYALSILKTENCQILSAGYSEDVRNGIAHGQVVFGQFDIRYYSDANHLFKLNTDDFLHLFDTIFRTSNSLAIAILLFLANNPNLINTVKNILPIPIIVLIASAGVERRDFLILGAIESELPSGDKQLHVSMKTGFVKRIPVMLDCARTALHLMDAGALGYRRYLFDIQQNDGINSLLIIKLNELELLQNESFERFAEILDASLLWKDEHSIINLLRALKLSLRSYAQLYWREFISYMQSQGLLISQNRFHIKRVENASAGGIARVHIYVALKFTSDVESKGMIRAIAQEIINKFQKQRIPSNPSRLEKKYNWKKPPKYIWISLYRLDGTARWVTSDGWLGKNLIATIEKCKKGAPPIFVKKPDETWMGIRFQYSIDHNAFARAMADMLKLTQAIQQSRELQDKTT